MGLGGRSPGYDLGGQQRAQLLAQLGRVNEAGVQPSGAPAAAVGAGGQPSNRTQLVALGRQLARSSIRVEMAVDAGLLGGFGAIDVRALYDGWNSEDLQMQERERASALAAQGQAQAQSVQASTATHQAMLRQAQARPLLRP